MILETFIGDYYINATEYKSGKIKINFVFKLIYDKTSFDTWKYDQIILDDFSKPSNNEISSKILRHISELFPEYLENISKMWRYNSFDSLPYLEATWLIRFSAFSLLSLK